ncbi:MAG TPA: isoprenylcysteine carboxylmethyltransferase family protein [Myxococcota bacterium]|nr:isoprenylcysteine carboxylmethyltransferase family protein [Myxococcota bacterium]
MNETPQDPAGPPEENDGAAVRFPPPFVPLVVLGVGVLVHALVWPLDLPVAGLVRWGLAALLVAAGIALMAGAIGLFKRTGQDPKPWLATPEIISSGVYRFTRNPMYLGMGVLQAGLGVALANAWVVLLVPVTGAVIQTIAIRHEEAYLERKFGTLYADYRSAVRRWL